MIEDVLGEGSVSASRFSRWFSNPSRSGSRSSSLGSTPHEELERLAGKRASHSSLVYELSLPWCGSFCLFITQWSTRIKGVLDTENPSVTALFMLLKGSMYVQWDQLQVCLFTKSGLEQAVLSPGQNSGNYFAPIPSEDHAENKVDILEMLQKAKVDLKPLLSSLSANKEKLKESCKCLLFSYVKFPFLCNGSNILLLIKHGGDWLRFFEKTQACCHTTLYLLSPGWPQNLLCKPGWPITHREALASVSRVQVLKVYTIPSLPPIFTQGPVVTTQYCFCPPKHSLPIPHNCLHLPCSHLGNKYLTSVSAVRPQHSLVTVELSGFLTWQQNVKRVIIRYLSV